MAGCTADHIPVVVAAVQAVCDPAFDLTEMQGTTHCHRAAARSSTGRPARMRRRSPPASAPSGPATGPTRRSAERCGSAMMNLGGARPGTSDMALLGHPGKFTILPRRGRGEASPLGRRCTSRLGYAPEDSDGDGRRRRGPPLGDVASTDADDPDSPQRLLRALATSLANAAPTTPTWGRAWPSWSSTPTTPPPWPAPATTARRCSEALCELAVNRRGDLRRVNASMARRGSDDDLVRRLRPPGGHPRDPGRRGRALLDGHAVVVRRAPRQPRSPSGSTSTRPATSRAPAADRGDDPAPIDPALRAATAASLLKP